MYTLQAEANEGSAACRGFRGIQSMRRSRSTGALSKPHAKQVSARDNSNHGFRADGVPTKLLQATLSTLGLDLVLPPVTLSSNWKPKVQVDSKQAYGKRNGLLDNSMPRSSAATSKGTSTSTKRSCSDRLLGATSTEAWVHADAFPGHVEYGPYKWRHYCQDVSSYEDVLRMTAERDISQSITSVPNPATSTNSLLRHCYANAIQFCEQYQLGVGLADAILDDAQCAAKLRQISSSSRLQQYWTVYCREITAYEELHSIFGEDYTELDGADPANSREPRNELNNNSAPFHYFGRPIHSYDDLHYLLRDDCAFDEAVSEDTMCKEHWFFGTKISSYEELYSLVGDGDCRLDGESYVPTKALQLRDSCERAFYCSTIQSYEHLLFVARDLGVLFDDDAANR